MSTTISQHSLSSQNAVSSQHTALSQHTASQTAEQTVFVLDDEPAIRDSLRCLLETEHYHVETFDSPGQFLKAADSKRAACLILDLKMPQMNGLDVLQLVARQKPRLPTIVLTAYADTPSIVTAMRSGAVNLLEKPCSDVQLLDAVREAMAQADQQLQQASTDDKLQAQLNRLTAREREILDELVAGKNVKQIGIKFGTSPNTVRNQRASILEKMGADSLADLVRMVLEGRGQR
jgi:FixJ family two-component response regulator